MITLSKRLQVPPLGTPEAAHLQKLMDMDIAFRLKMGALQERLPHLLHAGVKNTSGLQQSKLLRSYFVEYNDRYLRHGPDFFPSSFNVVESFMTFDRKNIMFDLLNEKEHLLAINDYFHWYEKGDIPRDPCLLRDMMTEGVIYSYDMVSDQSSLRISGDSQQVFAGASFVRHDYELSCLLLAGENPPLHSDEEILKMPLGKAAPGREALKAAPGLTVKDRYLDGYPLFAKVVLLTRFDLGARKHGVRYVNLDDGLGFTVFTDDSSVFGDLSPADADQLGRWARDGLLRYEDLFSALSSMIYLPAFFAAYPGNIQELEVMTELQATRDNPQVRETMKKLGGLRCTTHRTIRCLSIGDGINDLPQTRIEPPPMEFINDGYWKAIGPQEIGEDKNGKQVFGRTWVSRHESWSAQSPRSFLLQQNISQLSGPDPGQVYIQRSPAHEINLYKVGLTRRGADIRAGELNSATGVPLPFGILAKWKVGDCARVEREIHARLAAFRINPRREFFCAELSQIVRIVETVIKELS